jgi:hypothetical protein
MSRVHAMSLLKVLPSVSVSAERVRLGNAAWGSP